MHGEVTPEKSPKGTSKANGEVERAVQEAHGLEIQLLASLPHKCPLLAWLIELSAVLYTIFHEGEPFDGMTPYWRLKGKNWTVSQPAFGEAIEFRRRTRHELDSRWQEDVFL